MKICIPTESDAGRSAKVHGHFGSAPYFTLYDTEAGTVEILANSNHQHVHGACQPLGALAGRKVEAVVSAGMGLRALQKLQAAGLKVYRAVPGTAEELALRFQNGQLDEITLQDACARHECH